MLINRLSLCDERYQLILFKQKYEAFDLVSKLARWLQRPGNFYCAVDKASDCTYSLSILEACRAYSMVRKQRQAPIILRGSAATQHSMTRRRGGQMLMT